MSQPEEYQAVRRHAGLIDCSAWGVVEVRGADRVAFLHNLLTQDIKTLASGMGGEAALVNPTAKLLADLVVLADVDAHWLILPRSRTDTALKTLEHYLIAEDVTIHDRTSTHVILALQGPATEGILQEMAGATLATLPALAHQMVTIQDVPVRAVAHSITGSPGFLLVTPAEHTARLRDYLLHDGRAKELRRVGREALNVLRLEAGIPWYGVDMDESNLLPETGLEARTVSQTKGCYVGQEVIARLATHGSVSRKLMGLICEGQEVPQPKDVIMSAGGGSDPGGKDGQPVGEITSACFSPALKRPIALGYVKRPWYEVGTTVTIARGDQMSSATLVSLPFVQF